MLGVALRFSLVVHEAVLDRKPFAPTNNRFIDGDVWQVYTLREILDSAGGFAIAITRPLFRHYCLSAEGVVSPAIGRVGEYAVDRRDTPIRPASRRGNSSSVKFPANLPDWGALESKLEDELGTAPFNCRLKPGLCFIPHVSV